MRRLALIAISLLVALGAVVAVAGPGSSRGAGSPYLVRAIFDNAAFAVDGEDVRIAGADVGSIQSLDVTPDRRHAAVTLSIDDARFTPFYANATAGGSASATSIATRAARARRSSRRSSAVRVPEATTCR